MAQQSQFFHLVISPKEFQDPKPLLSYLHDEAIDFVVSKEYGDTGHPHIDSFFKLPSKRRQDAVRKSILGLYPDIPTEQRRNVKVIIPVIDKDPRYGFGYSLKEGEIIRSTLTSKYEEECQQYYRDHKESVQTTLRKKTGGTAPMTTNQLVDGYCAWFIKNHPNEHGSFNYFNNYCVTIDGLYNYSSYSKVKEETVFQYLNNRIAANQARATALEQSDFT